MRSVTVRMIWVLAFLLTGLAAGCGREQAPVLVPAVTATVPANGATGVALNGTVSADFNLTMDATTINTTTFTLTGPGGTAVLGTVSYAGTTATFTPTASLAVNTMYTATITTGAQTPTGQALAANYVWTFSTASQPFVTSTNPANTAAQVPINQKIVATFSEPMSAATIIAPGTFTVAAGGSAVPGTVTYDPASDTAIFTPTANLAGSTLFTAKITTAAQNPSSKALASDYIWGFTTGALANATAPTVLLTDPVATATNVPLNQEIAVTFSEAMDPATISATGTFTVATTVGATPITGTVTYDAPSNTAVFTPTANLAASTQFTATISNAAKDLDGNALKTGNVPNPWTFTTGTALDTTAPTVTLTYPVDGATAVPIDATVNATFSTAMNPAAITTETFLVTATTDGTPVSGTVAYDAASQIATFIPSANLAANTQYTATISPTVQDLDKNALAAGQVPNPWSFTTGAVAGGAYPATVNLGAAGSFAVLATALTTSTGPVIVNGNVGVGPGTSQGIPPAQVNGTIYGPGTVVTQAQAALLAAYNDAVSRSTNSQTLPGDMGGLVFTPGLYKNSTSVLISTDVTLDAQGNPNAVFIFQMGSTLTTAGSVILAGGAKASNIFWVVGTSATLGTNSIFQGTVLADVSITQDGGAVVNGRLFAGSGPGGAGSVTVNGASVNVPQQ
ncbi:MAG: Ig-like domain-containing protein [Candidatus Acidiferrales bacterium]